MQQVKTRSGFTLIELTLSILFLALLSLTIALVINNIVSIYAKGLSIKSVNSAGSDLIEEFSNALGSAPATELTAMCDATFEYDAAPTSNYQKCRANHANLFVFSQHKTKVDIIDNDSKNQTVQRAGVFCTGKYSYIWNSGYVENSRYRISNTENQEVKRVEVAYLLAGDDNVHHWSDTHDSTFRFLRLEDPSRIACASQLKNYGTSSNRSNNTYDYNEADTNLVNTNIVYDLTKDATGSPYSLATEPIELITETEHSLALYNFYVAPPSQDSTTHRLFYAGSFVLATLAGGVDITATGDYCQLKGETENFDYCAINKFNFAAQATGK